ncbi:unnamed protein product [Xylocopa violacea]|uniref:Uncharacterized protein n=1 Tax=Xylocopa violacea TaxID=135666 RepID=A0ABP1PHA4_XYLVO
MFCFTGKRIVTFYRLTTEYTSWMQAHSGTGNRRKSTAQSRSRLKEHLSILQTQLREMEEQYEKLLPFLSEVEKEEVNNVYLIRLDVICFFFLFCEQKGKEAIGKKPNKLGSKDNDRPSEEEGVDR